MNRQSNLSSNSATRVILVVLIGFAALSTAIKELGTAQVFVADVVSVAARWSHEVVPTASAGTRVTVVKSKLVETCDLNVQPQRSNSSEFRWNGAVAPGQTVEVKGINGDINVESSTGNEVQVLALKTSRRSDVETVQIKVVPHSSGVTICALYPNESGEYNECHSDSNQVRSSSTKGGVRNNDVRVDFTVKIPAQVAFNGKTVNGDIAAKALTANVNAKSVNGSISISTTGYAEAATVNGEISARMGDAAWSTLNFKTVNGAINLDLPATLSTDIDAQTLNGQITSDFPINLSSVKDRKHLRGRIGVGGRELILKTLNGSITLRVAS